MYSHTESNTPNQNNTLSILDDMASVNFLQGGKLLTNKLWKWIQQETFILMCTNNHAVNDSDADALLQWKL